MYHLYSPHVFDLICLKIYTYKYAYLELHDRIEIEIQQNLIQVDNYTDDILNKIFHESFFSNKLNILFKKYCKNNETMTLNELVTETNIQIINQFNKHSISSRNKKNKKNFFSYIILQNI